MNTGPLSRRTLLTRIAVAFVVPWLAMLLTIEMLSPSLIAAGLPPWTGVSLIGVADVLIVLSIMVLPLVVWLHARLCRYRNHSLRAHISIGPATASLVVLIAFYAPSLVSTDHRLFFLALTVVPSLFACVIGIVIGGVSSGSAWYIVVKSLRIRTDETAG